MPKITLALAQDKAADKLLADNPLALLIGMVLDQQIPLERAFSAPAELARRLGRPLDVAELAAMDPDELSAVFRDRPALHRYPGSMAARVQEMCRIIVEEYDADPASIWKKAPDGKALMTRIKALPGFGEQKARIFVALIGKQLGVRPAGWEEATTPFGAPGSYLSVADIVDAESLARVRAFKQERKQAAKAQSVKAASKAGSKPTAKPTAKAKAKAKAAAKPAATRSTTTGRARG